MINDHTDVFDQPIEQHRFIVVDNAGRFLIDEFRKRQSRLIVKSIEHFGTEN